MKTGDRLDRLERAITIHLEESGEIRADIKWLKKFMWFVVGTPLVTEVIRHIWR